MKTKKTTSEKGAGSSPTSKKPKAVTTKKQERTPSSKTATPTAGPKKLKTIAKPQPPTSEVVSAKNTKTTKPERTPSSKTATPTAGPKNGKTIAKPQPPTSEEVYTKISKLAYELYEQRGWHQGQELSDWLDAERQVFAQEPLVTTLDHLPCIVR